MIGAERGLSASQRPGSAFLLCFSLPLSRSPLRSARPSTGAGPRQDAQVIRDDAEADPPFHPAWPAIPTAPEPVAAFEDTDSALAAGAPTQRSEEHTSELQS